MSSSRLPDADTRQRIGPWFPDRVPSLDAFEPDTNFLIRASAGSGKTTALVARMVALVRTGVPLDDCSAITFTRKAASEMKARLYQELQSTRRQLLADSSSNEREVRRVTQALGDLPGCFIGTIHSFCARLLREHPLAAGLPPDFTAGLDERDRDELRQQVWQSYLSDVWAEEPDRVTHVAELGIEPRELEHFFGQLCRYPDLTPYVDGSPSPPDLDGTVRQLSDALDRWYPALPDDPADGDAKPGTTADAVREAYRMRAMRPLEDPAAKAEFIGLFDGITKDDTRKSTDTTIRGDLTKSHWLDEDLAERLDNDVLPALAEEVIQPALRQWRAYVHRELVDFVEPAVSRYADHRRQTGQLTFQDLLIAARDLLRDNPTARRSLQARYPRLLVDEFQDTDPIQAELLFFLASEDPTEDQWRKCPPRDGSLFIVGDDKQSIYRFRRADLDVYSDVRWAIDQASNGEDVVLESNFRSAPSVLDWCNDAFGTLFDEIEGPYQASYVPFKPARTDQPDGPAVTQLQVPYVKGSSSTRQIAGRNAQQIAALIASACSASEASSAAPPAALQGDEPGDFMILTRNTTRLDEFAEALAERGLPYTMAGGNDVHASTELYALNTLLRVVERPQDPVARVAYLRGPLVGLSDDALYRFRASGGEFDGPFRLPTDVADGLAPALCRRLEAAYDHLDTAVTLLRSQRPAAAIEQIVEHLGLMSRARRDPGMGSLHAGRLLRVLTDVQRLDAEGHPWTAIREELQLILDGERSLDGMTLETGTTEAVRLLNVHKAKGLEAPVVFLADPYGGQHPKDPDVHVRRDTGDVVLPVHEQHQYHRSLRFAPASWETDFRETESRYQRAEEHRLLYVAATRAEEQLVVSRYRSPSWSRDKGYWAPLYPFVDDAPALEPPSDPPRYRSPETGDAAPSVDLKARRDRVSVPTYATEVVTNGADAEPPSMVSEGYGADFGTAVHRLFEYAIQRRETNPKERISDALIASVLEDHDVASETAVARSMLDDFLNSELWKTLRRAEVVHTELPVAALQEGELPTLVDGTIDLLYRESDHWHLVDIKTEPLPDGGPSELLDQYRSQLNTYARIWHTSTGTAIARKSLWLAAPGRLVTLSPDS